MKTFLVIDDHVLVRQGLTLTLRGFDPQAIVFEAAEMNEALLIVQKQARLDLVVLDLFLPLIDGMAGLGLIKKLQPSTPVVICSAQYSSADVQRARDRGADGFIPKSYSSAQIQQVIARVLTDGHYFPEETVFGGEAPQNVSTSINPMDNEQAGGTKLTDRQMQVLALLVQGKPNKIIADELSMAAGTVKIHISSVLRALQVTNRTQAVLAAARLGIKL